MALVKQWTWDYEIHELGCWPTRPPYAGHAEPVEVYKAADVEAVLKPLVEKWERQTNPRESVTFRLAMKALKAELDAMRGQS